MHPPTLHSRALVALGLAIPLATALAPAGRAAAQGIDDEPWFVTVDAMLAGPINEVTQDQFSLGGSGAIGVYRSFYPELAFGFRLSAGALTEGEVVFQDPVDRGWLDFGHLSASMRVRPLAPLMDDDRRASGLWIQMGGGPGIADGEVVPVFDIGLGYGFELGPIVLSPMGQITHIIETEGRFGEGNIFLWHGGVEVAFLDELAAAPGTLPAAEPLAPPASEPIADIEREAEEELEEDAALEEPPALKPEEDVAQPFVNDQLSIDERVFFDFDRWEIRPTGREQLDEIVRRYEESGDRWEALIVSGHADRRGPIDYNQDLSRKRAEAVREYLTARGVPIHVLEIEAWGETRPEIADADTEYEHQVNRRVQFEIVWQPGMRPEGQAPPPVLPEPDYVDPAPPHLREAE